MKCMYCHKKYDNKQDLIDCMISHGLSGRQASNTADLMAKEAAERENERLEAKGTGNMK